MKHEDGLTLGDLLRHAESIGRDPDGVYLLTAGGNPVVEIDDTMVDLWFLGDEDMEGFV